MIEKAIRQFIVNELHAGSQDLTNDYPLLDRGILDSLGLFQLVAFLETEFDVQIDDEELVPVNFGTIDGVARLIDAKRAAIRTELPGAET